MKSREKFGSRLGFLLVSAGCAVGLGNVWKFPYMCGQYGGAAFILIYLVFLVIMVEVVRRVVLQPLRCWKRKEQSGIIMDI